MDKLFWMAPYVISGVKIKMRKVINNKGEFGIGAVLSIATALIISAFVLIPNMTDLAREIMERMTSWWDGMGGKIFITSVEKK